MPFFGFTLLCCCFALSLGAAFLAVPNRAAAQPRPPHRVEKANLVLFACLTTACCILTAALAASNFSFLYAVLNSDRELHLFYRITALWGGQEGALLFWTWCAVLFAVLFQVTGSYKSLPATTQRWYWSIFFTLTAFFCLLLISWNNPFLEATPRPADGFGLNPLLQNPGMIFHPPLLFLGYGAFTVPVCLALASLLTTPERSSRNTVCAPLPWAALTRPFILLAWLLLGAGIILGGWWSYMELGWGGYWAWDPVENSSLVPWLLATAYLHTAVVEKTRGKLYRTNAFLMSMVLISAFFSTYLVRGGVVRSVHAFGQSEVGMPLLIFTLLFLVFAVFVARRAPRYGSALDSPLTREGLLVCTAHVLIVLACSITIATLWPVFSLLWSEKAVVLNPSFYNITCTPLFVLLAVMLAVCPWTSWNGSLRHKGLFTFTALLALAATVFLLTAGFTGPLPLTAAAAGIAILAGTSSRLAVSPGTVRAWPGLAAPITHCGFALILLGIAFSGPYKVQEDIVLKPGQTALFGGYTLHLAAVTGGDSHDHEPGNTPPALRPDQPRYLYSEAFIQVARNGEALGALRPQLRRYTKFPDSTFSEVDTVFSWGNELYCSMLGVDASGSTTLQVSINPLVNWIWAGGVILCLAPLLGIRRRQTAPDEER